MKGKKIVLSLAASLGAVAGLAACKDNVEEVTKYNVIFMNGDEVLSETEVVEGEYFAIPSAPAAAEGYYFAGWDGNNDGQADDVTKATADITYKAVFEALPEGAKTVTFKNGDTIVGVVLYNSGDEDIVEPQVPAKAGYTGSWEAYELNGEDIVVNASYVATRYFVNYVVDGVTISRLPFTVENPQVTAPQVPTKEGYSAAWETYSLDGVTSDIYVNAIYTANPLTINDFLGIYNNGEETISVTPTEVEVYFYDTDFDRYVTRTFVADSEESDYYFKVEGNNLNLYDYMDEVQKSYQLIDGKLVANTNKVEVSTWGSYEYKVDGVVSATLKIDEDGFLYTVGDKVYDAAYAIENDAIVVMVGEDSITFNLNSNNNYELTVGNDTQEFVKVVPTEWYGTYYYAQNYPSQITISAEALNDIKLVKDGFEYQGTTFIPTDSGSLNYIDWSGNLAEEKEYDSEGNPIILGLAEYVKLENQAVPESLYGLYRGSYSTVTISEEGVTVYGTLVPMSSVVYSVGKTSDGDEIRLLSANGNNFEVGDGTLSDYSTYYKSNVEDTTSLNTTIPAEYDAYKNILYTGSGLLFEMTDNSISYSASGYGSLKFYVDDAKKIHIFKSTSYAIADEIIVEIVDGKLMVDGVEYAAFNIALDDIIGTYLNGDNEIVVTADGINYLGDEYAKADLTISVYSIKLTDTVTLVYDPDTLSFIVGGVSYTYSPTLSLQIPEEMYGSYFSSAMGQIKIDKSGVYYIDLYNNSNTCSVVIDGNNYSLSYVLYGSKTSIDLTYNETDKQFVDGDNVYTKLLAQVVPSTWVEGTYEAKVMSWGSEVTYSVVIDGNSITYVNNWGEASSNLIIVSDTNFYIGTNSFVYDVEAHTISANIPGAGSVVFEFVSSNDGGNSEASTEINSAMIGTWTGTGTTDEYWTVEIVDEDGTVTLAWANGIGSTLNSFSYTVIDENTIKDVAGYQFHYDADRSMLIVTDTFEDLIVAELTLGGR